MLESCANPSSACLLKDRTIKPAMMRITETTINTIYRFFTSRLLVFDLFGSHPYDRIQYCQKHRHTEDNHIGNPITPNLEEPGEPNGQDSKTDTA